MSAGLFFTDSPPGANASKDAGFGAQPGDDGRNGVGIATIEQIPGTYEILVTLDDGRRQIFPMPAGPGGLDGITPEFVAGDVTYGPISTGPKLTPRRIALAVFALDLTLPDLTLATQAAAASLASAQASAGAASASAGSAVASDGSAKASASSAAAAAGSVTAAQTARTGAEAALDSFDDRYLGDKASDPTTDNDGNALLVGALYYNTGAQPGMRIRTASGTWDKAYASITGGVTSFKGREGAVSPQTGDYNASEVTGAVAGPDTAIDGAVLLADGTSGKKAKAGPAIGTAPGNLVRLDAATGKLPAVDASALFNLPGDASVSQDVRALALMLAEMKGDRLNMKDGIADPLTDASDLSTAGSSAYTLTGGLIAFPEAYGENIASISYSIASRLDNPENAYDGNANTSSYVGYPSMGPNWVGQDFGPGNAKSIRKVTLTHNIAQNAGYRAFVGGKIQYSDNFVAWVDAAYADIYAFTVDFIVPNVGPHRYWRFIGTIPENGNSSWAVVELAMFPALVTTKSLVSAAFPSQIGAPASARIALQIRGGDTAVAAGDIVASASRDGGATFVSGPLVKSAALVDGTTIYEAATIFSGMATGTSMVWRFQILNNAAGTLSGVVFQWRA